MSQKHQKHSPTKGTDNCKACNKGLNDDSCALLSDSCEHWLCIESIDMNEMEYHLLTKITRRLGSVCSCPGVVGCGLSLKIVYLPPR